MNIGPAGSFNNPSAASVSKSPTFPSPGKERRHSFSLIECSSAPSLQQRKAIATFDLESSKKKEAETLQEFGKLKRDFDAFIKEFKEQNDDFTSYIDGLMVEFEQIALGEDTPLQPMQALNPQIENLQASVNELHGKLQEIQQGVENATSLINTQKKAPKPPVASKPSTVFGTAAKIASIALPVLAGGAIIAGALFFLSKSR